MTYKVNDLVYFEGDWKKGVGKVVAISGKSFLVHSTQIAGGHDGNEVVEKQDNKNNWFFIEEHLKPFTKKVGQKYKVLRDYMSFKKGDIVHLDKIGTDGCGIYEDAFSVYVNNSYQECLYDLDHDKCEVEFYADVEDAKRAKENEMFTKEDLKAGYLVKMRNGKFAHVVNTINNGICFNFGHGSAHLSAYKENLISTSELDYEIDIVEVYGYTNYGLNSHKFEIGKRRLIWKREEVKEMTIEDIQKALGHKIKVVE